MVSRHHNASALLELMHGAARVVITPTIGGSIAAFTHGSGNGTVHWLRPASRAALEAGDPLGMASFPLVPFCNRIRDGRLEVDGHPFVMPPNIPGSPHPLHGIGWQRPWEVTSASPAAASLSVACDAGEWPWPFLATQDFRVDDHGLHVRLSATNTGSRSMPLGLGLHPFFPNPGQATMQAAVSHMWTADAEVMPGTLVAHDPAIGALDAGLAACAVDLDNNFVGWNGDAAISWPGRRLDIKASGPLGFLVLYTPPQQDYFCVEPVSNCTDWINLSQGHGQSERGGTMLAPGATYAVQVSFLTHLQE